MARRTSDDSASRCNILVTVDEKAGSGLDEIAAQLQASGMKVVEVLPLGGVIAGEARDEDLGKLRKVRGVSGLEIDSMFTAAPS
jgi:hypothetical protein